MIFRFLTWQIPSYPSESFGFFWPLLSTLKQVQELDLGIAKILAIEQTMMINVQKFTPLQVSKWVKIPLLIDLSEMEDLLLNCLPSFQLFDVQRVVGLQEGVYTPGSFLSEYARYIGCLKEGVVPSSKEFRHLFSMAWSVDVQAIRILPTADGRRLLKPIEPIVQTQMNEIRYSPEEKAFRIQIFGSDSISWGLQIGFPHVFMDPSTFATENTRRFPNMALFSAIQRWIRSQTRPTPFIVNGHRMNSPIRLGKQCFSWIASHPHLVAQEIKVDRP